MNLISKFTSWTRTLVAKIVATAIGLVAILGIIDFIWKWDLYGRLLNFAWERMVPLLTRDVTLKTYTLAPLIICALIVLALIMRTLLRRKKEYFIPIKTHFYTGFEPAEYSRKTKWCFKDYTKFYFIPLLSHSPDSVEFVDLCGPYCASCDHVLHLEGSQEDLGHTFKCINCIKSYRIPDELLGEYEKKLFSYFKEEYRQGRLGEFRPH